MATLPAIDLSYGTDLTHKYKRKRKQLGGGYSLRAKDGTNNVKQEWRLVWENISEANKTTLETFFNSRGGVTAFEWTPYGQVTQLKFISGEPNCRPSKGPLWNVTVDIEQVFDN
jgi:phage-related protein